MRAIHEFLDSLGDTAKHVLDLLSVGALVGYIADKLPLVATCLTILWMSMRCFDWIEARWNGRKPPKE